MKNKHIASFTAAMLLGISSFVAPQAFATGPYGITYTSGHTAGEELGSDNVTIDAELVNGLTSLITFDDTPVARPTDTNKWRTGYMIDSGACREFYFFTIDSDTQVDESDGLGYIVSNDQYDIEVNIKSVASENLGNKTTTFGFRERNGYFYGGFRAYADSECTQNFDDITTSSIWAKNDTNAQVFAELDIKLHKKGEESIFKSRDLYFGLTDIDAAQSYKVLNPSNLLEKSNTFAKNAADLQPDPSVTDLRNRYVADGNYIYSEYLNGIDNPTVSGPRIANIYIKLNEATQADGLDIVFGFANTAGSGIEYYAKQYTIVYESDENGEITGITSERIIAGKNPDGSEQQPNDGYAFKSWIADVDVELTDGATIKAGDPITSEQILQVIVNQNITFTAVYETIPDEGPENEPEDEDEDEDKD